MCYTSSTGYLLLIGECFKVIWFYLTEISGTVKFYPEFTVLFYFKQHNNTLLPLAAQENKM